MSDAANVIEVSVRPPSNFPARAPEVPPVKPAAVVPPVDPAVPVVPPVDPAKPATPPVPPAPANFDPPVPLPVPDAPKGEVIVEYTPTGDKGLDLALGFVGNLGFGPEREDMKAAMAGDFTKLEASLKQLGAKAQGFERYIDVAKDSYQRVVTGRKDTEAKITDAITKAAGGVEAWNAIHAWVAQEASPEQKAEITAAFKAGSYAAAAMATQLAALFKQSGKSELPPKSAVKEERGSVPDVSGGALTPQGFKEEIRRLEGKYGYRLQETDEYRNAVARRRQYQPQQ